MEFVYVSYTLSGELERVVRIDGRLKFLAWLYFNTYNIYTYIGKGGLRK